MTILQVENLSVGYDTKKGILKAVSHISFAVEKGRALGFVGESGCGKTTIGMTLMGLLPENGSIVSGSINFMGRQLAGISESQWRSIRGREIAMIFQAAMNALNPVLRVGDQVAEAIITHHPDMPDDRINERLESLFDMVGIPISRMSDYPHEFSGGMKQRVVIAMALACSPRLIIADEPTTALDVIVQDQILKAIKKIQKDLDTCLIFISHDISVVAEVCDDICVMYAGQIVESGSVNEVLGAPAHPYTKALLASHLNLDPDENIHIPDRMQTPDLTCEIPGCRFSSNCRCSMDGSCSVKHPEWIDLGRTHRVLCCEKGLDRKIS